MAASALLILPAALLLGVGVLVLALLLVTARPDHTLASEVASARRHGLVVGVLAGIAFLGANALLLVLASRPYDGFPRLTPLWLGSFPLIGALAALAVLALGELTWPRPRGLQRQVNLNPRSLRDLVPRSWGRVLVGLVTLTLVVIASGWWAADPSGHALSRSDSSTHRSTVSPFPGADYGAPQLVALGVALLVLYGVLRLVVLRPAVVRSEVATDNRLRAASAVRAIRVVVSALALTTGGNLFVGGSAGLRLYGPGWQQNLSAAAMLLGAVLGVLGLVLVLTPAPRLPRTDPVAHPTEASASV